MTCGNSPLKIAYVPITTTPITNVNLRGSLKPLQRAAVANASIDICVPLTDKICTIPVVMNSSTSSGLMPA